jgi:hypothetical protein
MTDFTDERRTDRAFYVVSVGSIRRKALSNKRKLDSRTLAVIALNNVSDCSVGGAHRLQAVTLTNRNSNLFKCRCD